MSTNTQAANRRLQRESNNSAEVDAAFKTSLDGFERALVRPIIPGELAAWLQEVRDSWREAATQLHYQIKHQHPRQYEEIGEQDPSLLPRIDLLKAEDLAIEEQREKFHQALSRTAEHIPELEPDEGKATKLTETLVDEGTAFITRIRKQVVAVQTWYIEAFNRDQGAVD